MQRRKQAMLSRLEETLALVKRLLPAIVDLYSRVLSRPRCNYSISGRVYTNSPSHRSIKLDLMADRICRFFRSQTYHKPSVFSFLFFSFPSVPRTRSHGIFTYTMMILVYNNNIDPIVIEEGEKIPIYTTNNPRIRDDGIVRHDYRSKVF